MQPQQILVHLHFAFWRIAKARWQNCSEFLQLFVHSGQLLGDARHFPVSLSMPFLVDTEGSLQDCVGQLKVLVNINLIKENN